MIELRIVPSRATSTTFDVFLEGHNYFSNTDTCQCGYEGKDINYTHIYKDMLRKGFIVLPVALFTDTVTGVYALYSSINKLLDIKSLAGVIESLHEVYVDGAKGKASVSSPGEHMESLGISFAKHYCMSLSMDGESVAITCVCQKTFNTDWGFEYHRFIEAVGDGVVFGKITDIEEITKTITYVFDALVALSVAVPMSNIDAVRSSVYSLSVTVAEVVRTQAEI